MNESTVLTVLASELCTIQIAHFHTSKTGSVKYWQKDKPQDNIKIAFEISKETKQTDKQPAFVIRCSIDKCLFVTNHLMTHHGITQLYRMTVIRKNF